ncbi:MAG: Gfo/Idh/MocA family protein [Sciscionella sp.]
MSTRVLIASGVRHAHDYTTLLAEMPGVEVIGVAESQDAPDWAVEDSAALACAANLPLLEYTAGMAGCDAVLVCSEPRRHAELAVRAVQASRHVIIDKPAATSADEFARLQRAAARAPELVVTSVHRLLSPAIVRTRHLIDTGGIGLPLSVDCEWIASGGLDGSTVERPELVCDPQRSGGGELTNFGWYPLLALRHFTGLEVTEVTGFGGALFGGPHERYGVEDCAVLSLLLERGVTATITVARVPAGISHEPISSTFRILGSHGHLCVDESEPTLRVRRRGEAAATQRTIGGAAGAAALRACFTQFFAAIEHGPSVTLGIADISRALNTLDSARQSIRTQTPVAVSSVAR